MKVFRKTKGMLSATIREIEYRGRRAVLKEFRDTDPLPASIIGPAMLRREVAALQQLEGLPGIPRVYGKSGRQGLILECIDGLPMKSYKAGELPDRFFRALSDLVVQMHKRGVVHLDLRHNRNIMVTTRGEPVLLDFANAFCRNLLLDPCWGILRKIDLSGVLKQKYRNFPHLVTPSDEETLRRHRILRRLWILRKRGKHSR